MTTRQSQAQVQAHLPPRCPNLKRPINAQIQNNKSSSQPFLEDHPAWLDDLLNDPDSNSKGGSLRRSLSDSVTLLDSVADSFSILAPHYDQGNSVGNPASSGLDSNSSMYGPNSPRLRSSSSFSENAIVSALSEYVSHGSGEYIDGGVRVSGTRNSSNLFDMNTDGALNDAKMVKRHPGQRSRIRKLQYIAELEKTVDVLQTLESDLAFRVSSLLQQRVALSMENNQLKQQLARVRKEKLIVDGEYQVLRKEAKRLKSVLITNSSHSGIRTCFVPNPPAEAGSLEAMQMALDMEKLNLY